MDSVVHFSYPRLIFLFESNGSALAEREFCFLIYFPQLLLAVRSWWRLKDAFEWRLPCIGFLAWRHNQRRRERTRTAGYLFWLHVVGIECFVGGCTRLSFYRAFLHPCRIQCYAPHWRQAAASSAPCALNASFDDGLNHNCEWNLSIRKKTSFSNLHKTYKLVTENSNLSFYIIHYQT